MQLMNSNSRITRAAADGNPMKSGGGYGHAANPGHDQPLSSAQAFKLQHAQLPPLQGVLDGAYRSHKG
jgi:hypothetical protein